MTLKHWKSLSVSTIFRNPWWTYRKFVYEIEPGKTGEYHSVHTNGAAMVVPVTSRGTVLLVNQYRFLLDRESIEFPCGGVKEGATHDETAWHELAEETGYSAMQLHLVGAFNPYNGVTNEMCHVYLAQDLREVGADPDETEEFEIVELTPAEIDARIRSGEIWDGMSIAAWAIAGERVAGLMPP